ncbi:MAG: outer membrane protein assembly factor BamE [Burkholderiaceae bacterium]|nr:outer membrane protein assembly factor BamE [Burkholderiaceae bacterium]
MLIALAVGLSGCGSFNRATQGMTNMLTLYQPEVVQGNFVSKEQAAQLQPGMTRLQVRDTLGTPLMASVFHGDRWDYVFTMKRQGVEAQSYRLTVLFKDDLLERFEGDEMPSEAEFAQRISRKRKIKVPTLEATEAQLAKFPPAANPAPAANAPTPAPAPTGNYPPLEPTP